MKMYRALIQIGAPGAPKALPRDIIPLDNVDAAELLAIGAVEVVDGDDDDVARKPGPASTPKPAAAPASAMRRSKRGRGN